MLLRAFALVACLSGAAALSMEQGLYPGRVGDVVFTIQPKSDEGAHLVLVGAGKEAGPSSMLETAVAPLAAHVTGALATAFPVAMPDVAPRVAERASALLTLTLESVTMADLGAFPQIAQIVRDGHSIRLDPAFEPRDRLSAAVSRATGSTPADHGIAAKAWLDAATSELVAAYSAGRDESAARVAAVSDVVAQSSAGRALILSLSSDPQLAAVGGTHPSLARTADGARWPTAVLAYDADTRQLKPTQLGAALPRGLFTVSLEEARAALAAAVPAEAAAADLSSPAMAALAAELGGILALLQRLPADAAVAPLLADGQSDVFSVSLAALAPLKSDAAARRLVDAALPKILAAFSGAWGGAASRVHLILAPADTDVHVDMAEGWTLLGAHAFAPAAVSHEAKLAACGKLAAAVEGSSIVAHCLAATGGDRRRLAAESPSITYTSDELELFQVTLWSSILLVVALLAGSCALYNMQVTEDSLLFSKGKDQ